MKIIMILMITLMIVSTGCVVQPPMTCGNGICEVGEQDTCPKDCDIMDRPCEQMSGYCLGKKDGCKDGYVELPYDCDADESICCVEDEIYEKDCKDVGGVCIDNGECGPTWSTAPYECDEEYMWCCIEDEPFCGNDICELGEKETCKTDCPTFTELMIVKLDQKFTIAPGDSAIFREGGIKLIMKSLEERQCIKAPCPSPVGMMVAYDINKKTDSKVVDGVVKSETVEAVQVDEVAATVSTGSGVTSSSSGSIPISTKPIQEDSGISFEAYEGSETEILGYKFVTIEVNKAEALMYVTSKEGPICGDGVCDPSEEQTCKEEECNCPVTNCEPCPEGETCPPCMQPLCECATTCSVGCPEDCEIVEPPKNENEILCIKTGGKWDECASACPDEEGMACIAMCMQTCICEDGYIWDETVGCYEEEEIKIY